VGDGLGAHSLRRRLALWVLLEGAQSAAHAFQNIAVVEVTLENPNGYDGVVKTEGGYLYLCLPWVSRWEWHAFSVFDHPTLENHSCVCISIVGDWTKAMREQLTSNNLKLHRSAGSLEGELEFYLPRIKCFDDEAWTFVFYTGKRKLNLGKKPDHEFLMVILGRAPPLEDLVCNIVDNVNNGIPISSELMDRARKAERDVYDKSAVDKWKSVRDSVRDDADKDGKASRTAFTSRQQSHQNLLALTGADRSYEDGSPSHGISPYQNNSLSLWEVNRARERDLSPQRDVYAYRFLNSSKQVVLDFRVRRGLCFRLGFSSRLRRCLFFRLGFNSLYMRFLQQFRS
jgi:hypothetical protein